MNHPRIPCLAALILVSIFPARADLTHTVAQGETLSSLAERYLGNFNAYSRIARANGIEAPYSLRIGQTLRIPTDTGSPTTSAVRDTRASTPVRTPGNPVPPSPAVVKAFPPEIEIEEQELVLIDVLGYVEKMRSGAVDTIARGEKLRPGDSIRTAPSSHALLSGMNGERFVLGPSTTAVIQELSATYSDRRIVVRIDQGQLGFSVPEIPFLSRYLFETPTGAVSTRFGSLQLVVRPPEFTSVSVFDGKAQAQVPMGSVDLDAGTGAVLRTMEQPPAPQPLPPRPGLSVETSATMIILAAAARPGQNIAFDVFSDGNYQRLFASKTVSTDATGVALTRIDLPSSLFWIRSRAVDMNGLAGEAAFAGPVMPSRN